MITELNEKNFDGQIANGLKLVEFYAKWCGYCQRQQPVLDELTKVWIGQVDIDENPNLLKKYNITGFPTFLVFKNGEVVSKFSGYNTKYELMEKLNAFMKN